jgi:hypothetical protein
MSHTIYAANGKVSHIHRRMCERKLKSSRQIDADSTAVRRTELQHILASMIYFLNKGNMWHIPSPTNY